MNLEARICHCGRIHFYDADRVYNAVEEGKDIILVCGGCGTVTVMGGDDVTGMYEDEGICYSMYAYDIDKETTFNADTFTGGENKKPVAEIIYSPGKKVMMMTGYYARCFSNDIFEDIWYPDFWKLEHKGLTIQEVMDFIEENRTKRRKVNMRALMKELTPEEAKVLHSRYLIEAFDWTETELGPQNF